MVQQAGLSCYRCGDSCYGDVVCLGGQYYHQYCFTCKKCNIDLVETGYFEVDGEYYCNSDYHIIKGTKCDGCGKFIEGEAVNAINSNFHQECFGCHSCGKLFPPGAKVVYDGEDFLCETCDNPSSPKISASEPVKSQAHKVQDEQVYRNPQQEVRSEPPSYLAEHRLPMEQKDITDEDPNCCAGCGNDIKSGQALLALEKQWHLWCFTCHKCGCLLAGEYMGRDGVPYCEQDYQAEFGVTCAGCGGYITGKVLQAGEKHYHPHCSRCAKCGDMFGEGEEMYLQGSEIWHPHCSEEYQRENEELEKAALHSGETNGAPSHVEMYNLGVSEAQTPQRSPNISSRGSENDFSYNGYKDHERNNRVSYSSEGSSENRSFSQPPGYNDFIKSKDNSMDVKNNNHSWNLPARTESKPLPAYDDFVKSKEANRPPGFRSVKPPQPVYNAPPPQQQQPQLSMEKPPSPTESDDEAPPPVPPPPTRSSSTAWKQKYSGQTAPKQTASPPNSRKNRGSMSFVDSAAARKSSSDQPTQNGRTTTSVSSMRSTSTSSSNEGREDRDRHDSVNKKIVQKGVGFNKLQLRKSLGGQPNGMGPSKPLDPEVLKKLNSDPNGNTYPYEVLKTTSYKTPLHLNRKILETYLTDTEFYDVFQMNRTKFYSLPKWKQEDLKKKATLF